MSAAILPFVHPLWISQGGERPALAFTEVEGYSGSFLLDTDLGKLLLFRDPLAAIAELWTRHRDVLRPHIVLVKRGSADDYGRTDMLAFDLLGALALCRFALTDQNAVSATRLACQIGHELAMNVMLRDLDEQYAEIIPLPRNAVREVRHV